MRKFSPIGVICAAIVAACAAAPAAEAGTIVTATWTGTLRAANDAGNHFGGTIAAGDAFTLKSVFDTAQGTFSGASQSILGGGKATLTIRGHAFTFDLDPSAYKLTAPHTLGLDVGDPSTTTFLTAGFFALGVPGSILAPFDADCFAATFCSGTFEIDGPHFSGGGFDADHISVAIAPTPIPASLPLFAAGLLGLGLALRRKAGLPV
jgi:hypothetical protein